MSLTHTIRSSDNLLCLPCVEISLYRNVRTVGGRTVLRFVDQMIKTYSLRKVSRLGSRVSLFPCPRLFRSRQGKAHPCPWPGEPEFRHRGTSDLRRKISSQASKNSESDGRSRSLRTGHWPAGRPGRVWGRSLGGTLLGSSSRDCLGKTETVRVWAGDKMTSMSWARHWCGHPPLLLSGRGCGNTGPCQSGHRPQPRPRPGQLLLWPGDPFHIELEIPRISSRDNIDLPHKCFRCEGKHPSGPGHVSRGSESRVSWWWAGPGAGSVS